MTSEKRVARRVFISEHFFKVLGDVRSLNCTIWNEKTFPDQREFIEVIPDEISDTERLNWLIENEECSIRFRPNENLWRRVGGKGEGRSPRNAIDAAMKEGE